MVRNQDFPEKTTKNTKDDDTMNDNRCPSLPLVTFGLMGLLFFGPWLGFAQAQNLPAEVLRYADMVLYNGQILTMDRDQPPISVREAVAVRDGRILAVGEDDRILQMAGPDTERVDLAGKTVTPGFVDTHSHPNSYALRHYRDEYTPLYLKALEDNHVHFARIRWDSVETAKADFKRFAEHLPPGEWIYTTSMLNPTVMRELRRDDLDEAVPDHPLYIMIGNAMRGLANTKMLDIIVEHALEDAGLVDASGLGTGESSFVSVALPCMREVQEGENVDGMVDVNGMLICKEQDLYLWWDAFTLGGVANGEIGKEVAERVRMGRGLRLAWENSGKTT